MVPNLISFRFLLLVLFFLLIFPNTNVWANSDLETPGKNMVSQRKSNDLWEAAKKGSLDNVNQLISLGSNLEERGDKLKKTPLMIAAQKGHTEFVKALIHAGANIEARGINGASAIGWAASTGKTECVKLLFEAGASKILKEDNGENLIAAAATGGYLGTLSYLISQGIDINGNRLYKQGKSLNGTPLMVTVDFGKPPAVLMLIISGADLNFQSGNGWTALMIAAKRGSDVLVSMLLAAGANVELTNKHGKNAWDIAREKNHVNVLPLLESASQITKAKNNIP